ncbi:Gfo/Idh/MocA family protein [Pseudoroseicyclus tamaricis]|uniref:Gfo/Idh/MocA family oxidoreductase n=1 Tax=Pseudoroseicyclus tamaricis TaxID=2705421 RepID=A0A6B2K1X9_9RHOB|nr:Gfo/Idh/MocA family oxidoreductase [Pseudoroseicyclus tamaricis]NDV02514.1 Gfo/Idh/MocA family oxidoreductase [Pseudoroseicyclus tamaricis]
MTTHRLLVLGTGGMAGAHVAGFRNCPNIEVVAGVDRNPAQLAKFCAEHHIPHAFTDLDEALAWDGFDCVTNVTPDNVHYATTLPLIAAGKHVMCEKPLAPRHADAREMAEAAQAAGIVNGVNLTYRRSAELAEAARLVAEGAIGELRHFEASYLQSWLTQDAWGDWRTDPKWLWRLSQSHGSTGCLGDIGVHILDFASHAAGQSISHISCRLATFEKAEGNMIGDYVLDANDSFTMQVRMENGALGVIHGSRFASGYHNDLFLKLWGTEGAIELTFDFQECTMRTCIGKEALRTKDWHEVKPTPVPTNYERFAHALDSGEGMDPDFARGAELQRVLDSAAASHVAGGAELAV